MGGRAENEWTTAKYMIYAKSTPEVSDELHLHKWNTAPNKSTKHDPEQPGLVCPSFVPQEFM